MTIDGKSKRIPPCVSYEDFEKFIALLSLGVPTHIDLDRAIGQFPENIGTELIDAMIFLHLIDNNNNPAPRLKLLVSATGEHRAALMRQIAHKAYAFVLNGVLDIQNAHYNELQDIFLNTYKMDVEIGRKCVNFFIDFCEGASIPLSTEIITRRKMLGTIPEMKKVKDKGVDDGTNPIDNRLQQVIFLYSIRSDFDRFDNLYNDESPVMSEYDDQIPKEMTEDNWVKVVDALRLDYEYVRFIYKIAMLTESGIISTDVLYSLYYEEIAHTLTFRLDRLIKWCGAGCETGLDFNPYNVARIAVTLINLLEKLNVIHREHGADLVLERDCKQIANFKNRTKSFISDPSEFDQYSPNYIDRKITMQDKGAGE